MTVSERMSNAGLVPVVVLENAADAVPTARALLAGGVDVMEITFRTAAAEDSSRAVAQECDERVVGAGTVVPLEQCIRTNSECGTVASPYGYWERRSSLLVKGIRRMSSRERRLSADTPASARRLA